MKVAIVYDRVNKWGGAERVLLALHEIWPKAPLYTAVYDEEAASWAKVFPQVIPSFLQKLPLAKNHHEAYAWLMPLAFESFNFDDYDLVISVTSEAAKGIITKPKTLHLCYCLTPTRYLWQSYDDYFQNKVFRKLSRPVVAYLRRWDKISSQRPDQIIAISNCVAQRIKKYYGREAEVIYPPAMLSGDGAEVANEIFSGTKPCEDPDFVGISFLKNLLAPRATLKNSKIIGFHPLNDFTDYFLVVSRLVPYKKVELAVRAFKQLGWPLKIIGTGVEEKKLKMMAKTNIEFLSNLTDQQLVGYYKNCSVLIMPQEEDFGLVAIEAQSFGKPVIAYGAGGALETIIKGKTGEFFSAQTIESLTKCLKNFKVSPPAGGFKSKDCVKNAERFSEKVFKEKFKKYAEDCLK